MISKSTKHLISNQSRCFLNRKTHISTQLQNSKFHETKKEWKIRDELQITKSEKKIGLNVFSNGEYSGQNSLIMPQPVN